MNKILVAYFSASGETACLAQTLAVAAQADAFAIEPVQPYTNADLNWNNAASRSSVEMKDPASRPALARGVDNMAQYDTILIGFPIWWYQAPRIIETFLESYDFSGKTVVLFATSGGSGMGETLKKLAPSCPNAKLIEGKVFRRSTGREQLAAWAEGLDL